MGGPPETCVYHAYEDGELLATGRLTLEELPQVGDELRLNGRTLIVREIGYGADAHVLTLETR